MELPLDPGADLACFDGLENVTLRLTEQSQPIEVEGALRRRMTTREAAASNGKYTADHARWHLPAAALPVAPLPGSVLVDAQQQKWIVQEVAAESLAGRYACVATKLAIVGGLSQRVDVYRASWQQSISGAPVAEWIIWRLGVPARVQPIDTEVEHQQTMQPPRATHRVYLGESVPVDHDTRFVHDGETYRVVGVSDLQRTDRLIAADVERVG